ncbi:protein unc-93 homolog A-like isoform X2 [Hydractinia symbiolongicarpus]|uniref:protein unc-93 homolog A-like isoform X2 n=1 Tax=Hydractinia symbiolongicarpus TaxID=13093 RepID=UPI00254F1288|nr:protein unc-93 homolog A-like isoform X2 [Hydractinia symbiolongicarpus]
MSLDASTTNTSSTKSTYKNLFVLGFVFFCIFTSYQSLQNLQSSIHEDEKIGLASLSVIYASFLISCLFLPPVLIKNLGCKYTIALSIVGYILYTAAHFYPTWWMFMTASAIIGTCAAPLWSAESSYLTTIALHHAANTKENSDAVITRFVGIFFMIFQLSQVCGNTLSSLILKHSSDNVKMEGENEECTFKEIMKKTFRSFKDWRMLFLMPITAYSGMESGFVFAEFNEAYVTCAVGIQKVGFIMIAFGVSNAISSYIVGSITKWLGRLVVIICAMVFNIGLVIWHHLWETLSSSLFIFFVTAAAWGINDSVWQTQTIAHFGVLFHSNKEISFSIYKLFQSLGFMVAFAYGDYLCVSHKLYILVCVLIISVVLYGVVEWSERKKNTADSKTISSFGNDAYVNETHLK